MRVVPTGAAARMVAPPRGRVALAVVTHRWVPLAVAAPTGAAVRAGPRGVTLRAEDRLVVSLGFPALSRRAVSWPVAWAGAGTAQFRCHLSPALVVTWSFLRLSQLLPGAAPMGFRHTSAVRVCGSTRATFPPLSRAVPCFCL